MISTDNNELTPTPKVTTYRCLITYLVALYLVNVQNTKKTYKPFLTVCATRSAKHAWGMMSSDPLSPKLLLSFQNSHFSGPNHLDLTVTELNCLFLQPPNCQDTLLSIQAMH